MRRATEVLDNGKVIYHNFNPRSPCGERQMWQKLWQKNWMISIHALHAESDSSMLRTFLLFFLFQSTLSMRRATTVPVLNGEPVIISIHALHAESDESCQLISCTLKNFNPRSPCGERQQKSHIYIKICSFICII